MSSYFFMLLHVSSYSIVFICFTLFHPAHKAKSDNLLQTDILERHTALSSKRFLGWVVTCTPNIRHRILIEANTGLAGVHKPQWSSMVFLLQETPKSESNFLRFVLKDFFYTFCFTIFFGPLWPFITSSKRANKLIPDYTNSMRFTQLLKDIESGYMKGQININPNNAPL